jgi:alpha-ketoglutarate-dependent taurine dioxygenase
MSAEWTIDSDAPGPRAVRDRTPVYRAGLNASGAGIGSTAALPLLTEVGALGYLGVWWAGPHEATAVEREYLRSMADTTSHALERARLREAERREHARVEALAERAHRAGRARVGQQGESWRRELTGEAENPLERPSYPLNAEPAAKTGRTPFGLPPIWLRVNCPCANCRDPRNGQRLVTITDLPRDVSVTSARRSSDRVEIVFGPDGHRATFDVGWLSQFATGDEAGSGGPRSGGAGPSTDALGGEDDRTEDAKRLWSADEITPAFPQGSWPLFRAEAAHQQACLAAVERDGFVVLRDVPREPGTVLTVAQSIGFVRKTERGPLIDVQVGALPPNQAFTGQPVAPRTAQPFRDPLPTLGLVHCLDDAAEGGESILVDGFHAAASLRAQDPAAFAVLASTEVTFAYADARAELRATRPVIGVDPRGRIREIRLSGTHMQPLRLPPDEVVVFYAAYRAFTEMTGWPGQMLTFPLRPGDCLILDNTRILNGRTSFAGGGKRHLQMCWTDLDGLASTLALMRRPRHNGRLRS